MPPGHRLAHARSADAARYHDQLYVYVDEPEAVAALIDVRCRPIRTWWTPPGRPFAGAPLALLPRRPKRRATGGGAQQ